MAHPGRRWTGTESDGKTLNPSRDWQLKREKRAPRQPPVGGGGEGEGGTKKREQLELDWRLDLGSWVEKAGRALEGISLGPIFSSVLSSSLPLSFLFLK